MSRSSDPPLPRKLEHLGEMLDAAPSSDGDGASIDVSVVVPCRNSADVIGDQLEALAAQETDLLWSSS